MVSYQSWSCGFQLTQLLPVTRPKVVSPSKNPSHCAPGNWQDGATGCSPIRQSISLRAGKLAGGACGVAAAKGRQTEWGVLRDRREVIKVLVGLEKFRGVVAGASPAAGAEITVRPDTRTVTARD